MNVIAEQSFFPTVISWGFDGKFRGIQGGTPLR